jgi:hypothetical protein
VIFNICLKPADISTHILRKHSRLFLALLVDFGKALPPANSALLKINSPWYNNPLCPVDKFPTGMV